MKRPMCVIGFSFSVAIWAAFQLHLGLEANLVAAFLLLAAALPVIMAPKKFRAIAATLLCAGLAFAWQGLYQARHVEPFDFAERQTIAFEGVVQDMHRQTGRYVRYTLNARFPDGSLPKAGLSLYVFSDADFLPGDLVAGKLRTFPRDEEAAFDTYSLSKGIALTGSMLELSALPPGSFDTAFRLERAVILFRGHLERNLRDILPASTAGFVQGVLLGDTRNISDEIYAAMQRTGTSHLLSVSGLHLSIVSGLVLALLRRLRAGERIQAAAAILCCLLFFAAAGFSPSLTRAMVMMLLVLSAGLFSRRADTLNSLGAALLLISLLRPYWTLGLGMWLSAASCAGIAVLARPVGEALRNRWASGDRRLDKFAVGAAQALGVSVGAYLFTLPLLFLASGWISLLSPLANLLLVPFESVILIGGMLCAVIPAGFFFAPILSAAVHACVEMAVAVTGLVSRLSFCTVAFDRAWMLFFLAGAAAGALLLLARRAKTASWAGAAAAAVLAFSLFSAGDAWLSRNQIELVTLGGDDGLSLLLRGGSAVILSAPDRSNAGLLLRYLDFRGIKHVDALLVPDHGNQIGSGLVRLAGAYPVACVVGPDDAVILEALSQAVPGAQVYPGTGASVKALGGADIQLDEKEMRITVDGQKIFKSAREYATIEQSDPSAVLLCADKAVLPQGVRPAWEPMGARLFGERRILLPVRESSSGT